MSRLMTILGAALVLPLAACGDDDPTQPAAEVSGSYTLETINGEGLPFTFDRAGEDSLQVTTGSITFRDNDRTFSDSVALRITIEGEVTEDDEVLTGTYTQSGTVVTLTPSEGSPYALSVSGNTLTQTFGTFVFVYRK